MEFDTYWQNGGYKKISDIIFAECHIFIVSNLCPRLERKCQQEPAILMTSAFCDYILQYFIQESVLCEMSKLAIPKLMSGLGTSVKKCSS